MTAVEQSVASGRDRRLNRLFAASDSAVECEIERLIVTEVRPVIGSVLQKYRRLHTLLSAADVEDLASSIDLRVLEALRAARDSRRGTIEDLNGFVAALANNVVSDLLRKRFPERARLKSRIRYALTHDGRLALWNSVRGPAGGLRGWSAAPDALEQVPEGIEVRPAEAGDSQGNALLEIFGAVKHPVLVEALVDFLQEAWNLPGSGIEAPLEAEIPSPERDAAARAEDLDFARALWREIRELRPLQRKALLLNLRYDGELDLLGVLLLSRIATHSDLAVALELSSADLVELWKQLPLDDQAIAEKLGVTRQQVINLRRAARERLVRRLPR